VQRDRAQVHDRRSRQYDVTSGPGEARVKAEVPVADHLHVPVDNGKRSTLTSNGTDVKIAQSESSTDAKRLLRGRFIG